jgi:uncharacterized protein (DUF1800 family)
MSDMLRKPQLALVTATLLIALSAPVIYAKKKTPAKAPAVPQLSQDEKILHVLNRLTFGARPGDVEMVRQIGIEKYIDQQLHPEQIAENPALDAKLAPLETLRLSARELNEKYPSNQALKAMAEGRKPLPTDPDTLAMIRRPLERYKVKKDAAAQTAGNDMVDINKPMVSMDKVSLRMTPEQRQAFRTGTPAEKVATLESMPADDQYDLLEAIGGRRQALMFAAPPDLARKVEKLNGPQFVVNQDLFANKLYRAVYSNRQLEEVLTDFWYNHFNVFIDKGADRYLVTSYERDAIRPHVLGKFKDLLLATAESPAMLFYLDNAQSVGADAMANRNPNAKNKRGLNENYGRELMELHTLGVDGGYTQQDVTNVARCFTGWTVRDPRGGGDFFYNDRMHDKGEKIVLGVTIPAGGGMEDGMKVLDLLEHSPATARFISKSLAIRFVSDNPPAALVDRMAATFTATEGDLTAVMKTMFLSPEFMSKDAYRAKVKTPLEMVVSALRSTNADLNFPFSVVQQLNQLGEPLYRKQEPTGYSNKSSEWVNSASLLARMNFSLALTNNKVPGVKVDLTGIQTSDPLAAARTLLMTDLSPEARTVITAGLADQSGKIPPAALVAGLALGSPDFQRR